MPRKCKHMNIFWPRGFTVPLRKKKKKKPYSFFLFIKYGFKVGGDLIIKIFFYFLILIY
jgi:hypothetical protein